jgi:hypothetical protein
MGQLAHQTRGQLPEHSAGPAVGGTSRWLWAITMEVLWRLCGSAPTGSPGAVYWTHSAVPRSPRACASASEPAPRPRNRLPPRASPFWAGVARREPARDTPVPPVDHDDGSGVRSWSTRSCSAPGSGPLESGRSSVFAPLHESGRQPFSWGVMRSLMHHSGGESHPTASIKSSRRVASV